MTIKALAKQMGGGDISLAELHAAMRGKYAKKKAVTGKPRKFSNKIPGEKVRNPRVGDGTQDAIFW